MKKNIIYTAILFVLPMIAFAEPLDGVRGFLQIFGSFINTFIKIIFGLAIVYFFWGMAQFILKSGDAKVRDDGKNKMIWGVIALFVMFSIYGIIYILGSIFGVNGYGINVTTGVIQ